jgi:gallate decarboxylase subunit D
MIKPRDTRELSEGEGRTRISISSHLIGGDRIVFIYNELAHLGAVALAEYDPKHKRASTSVITRFGHKDDIVAQNAAHEICKHTKKPVCVIAGMHLDDITKSEIEQMVLNSTALVNRFIRTIMDEEV